MIELLLDAIVSLGSAEVQNVLTSVGESAVKNLKNSQAWKKLIVGTGEFFIKNEQEENSFFKDLELVLSRENLIQIAQDLKSGDGYDLKDGLYCSLELICKLSKFIVITAQKVRLDYEREDKILIRRAKEIDIPKIEDLLRQVNLVHYNGRPDLFIKGVKYSDSQLSEMIDDDTRPIFVATDDNGQVTGYAFCIFEQHINDNILTDVKTLYIDDLCVDEQIRGQHIGKKLYEYIVGYAKENGCYNVTLNVWSCNVAAMKFYESCGLKPQKIHMETILD